MHWMDVSTSIGTLRLTGEGETLTGLYFPDGRHLPEHFGSPGETPALHQAAQWLGCYFAVKPLPPMPELRPAGTPFQQAVWALLREIPYGAVVTYGQIARRLETLLGHPVAAQAVGQAVGRNPISLLIPCHRVLGAGNTLTGYGGGLWRKKHLLDLENISYK